MDPIYQKEIFDNEDLEPDLQAIKPNVKGFKYMQPTEIQPEHIPDKDLFPEQWKHYDVDLNKVKED